MKSNPDSLLDVQAITTLPSSTPFPRLSQIISRTRFDTSPTYTPARTSTSQSPSRPRRRGGTFSATMTSIAQPLLVGNGHLHRLRVGCGPRQPASGQHLL